MRIQGDVLLVGSIPGANAEEAMRLCATHLGDSLACLPDGETGRRRVWINFLASGAYDRCPALETLSRPRPVDPSDPEEWRGPGEDWVPRGYEDHWQFRVREGAKLEFPELGYADEARDSYVVFEKLRGEGLLAPGARFMVAFPLAESGTRPFTAQREDYGSMMEAYQLAFSREIEQLVRDIPTEALAVQLDICMETLAIQCDDEHPGIFPWRPDRSPMDRYLDAVARAASCVPDEVFLGLHLCYGDLGHRHLIEPPDLSVCVEMANRGIGAVSRRVDFVHMPVPRDRSDDAYFAPLERLAPGDARVYLGLVHHTDGAEGSLARLATAKRHAAGFGVATECGFGRRAPETIPALLDVHRAVAREL